MILSGLHARSEYGKIIVAVFNNDTACCPDISLKIMSDVCTVDFYYLYSEL